MEEAGPTEIKDLREYSFDSSNFELIAQGAEGVRLLLLFFMYRDCIKEHF